MGPCSVVCQTVLEHCTLERKTAGIANRLILTYQTTRSLITEGSKLDRCTCFIYPKIHVIYMRASEIQKLAYTK
jgi:hypothetical protein